LLARVAAGDTHAMAAAAKRCSTTCIERIYSLYTLEDVRRGDAAGRRFAFRSANAKKSQADSGPVCRAVRLVLVLWMAPFGVSDRVKCRTQ
jgi:hypothetical protein